MKAPIRFLVLICGLLIPSLGLCETAGWEMKLSEAQQLNDAGQMAECIAAAKEAYQLVKEEQGESGLGIAKVLKYLGAYHEAAGRLNSAGIYWKRHLKMMRGLQPRDEELYALAVQDTASYYLRHGKLGEADRLFSESLSLTKQIFGERSIETTQSLGGLAEVRVGENRLDEAIRYFKEVIDINAELTGLYNRSVTAALSQLGSIYTVEKRWGDAIGAFTELDQILAKIDDATNSERAVNLIILSRLYEQQSELGAAKEALQKAKAFLEVDDPTQAGIRNQLNAMIQRLESKT